MTPLELATIDDLLDELKKRTTCMAFAAYYRDDGDVRDNLSFGLTFVGYAHERVGLAAMLTLRAKTEMDRMVNPPPLPQENDDAL